MTSLKRLLTDGLQAARLKRRIKAIRNDRLTYLSNNKLMRLDGALKSSLALGAAGDVLEFGVALGGSSILLAEQATAAGRRFMGFDVFAMIPPPTSEHDDEKSKTRYEVIASGQSKGIGGDVYYGYRDDLYGEVRRSFERHGLKVDDDRIQLHKGLFEETWPSRAPARVSFAHIDCDWYDPVRYCLESVTAVLSPGGCIMLDDYHDYGGCRTATDEFLAENPNFDFEDGENVLLRRVA